VFSDHCFALKLFYFAISFWQIAFRPKFLPSRVEKERKAILSELQMMNTIDYRIDCQASDFISFLKFSFFLSCQLIKMRNSLGTLGH
jgi:hypothetical protein